MLLLDASKNDGAICCENDSMSLLHFPGPCLAEGFAVGSMRVLHVRRGWLMV